MGPVRARRVHTATSGRPHTRGARERDEAGDAAFAAYMARERHEADAKLKGLQEAWRKESNAKDRSTNRRVAELKAENDRLRGLYSATQVKELPTDKGLAKVKEARMELERLRALHG